MLDLGRHPRFVALSGGVGGAKLVFGLSRILEPGELMVVANTGDDFEHLGLVICPDLDTLLYTLAGRNNKELGWGQVDESWNFMDALGELSAETWFRLGDRDLATHVMRTCLLHGGWSLSDVVDYFCLQMGIGHRVVPMSDDPVRTRVLTRKDGSLPFQEYFVRKRCEPRVTGFEFSGIDSASPSEAFMEALHPGLEGVIVCPSNPFVSVDPVLKLPGVVEAVESLRLPVVVVSNIVGGEALKGPAAKMMDELGMPQTALAVAEYYRSDYGDLFTGFILDKQDEELRGDIEALGFATIVTNTVMVTSHDKIALAKDAVRLAGSLRA